MIPAIKLTTHRLYDSLIEAIQGADEIYVVVAFAQKSGVDLLYPALQAAVERGADIHFLIGDYLHITDPDALEKLLGLDGLSVRFYRSGGRSFHPKAYLFRNKETGLSIIGSSNISDSALRSGVEWNVHLPRTVAPDVLDEAIDAFMDLYLSENAQDLNEIVLADYRSRYEARAIVAEPDVDYVVSPEPVEEILPHGVQEAALEALRETLEEGRKRALVVLATGLGKTYLSAFLARDFGRVLFLAHRREILEQADRSFRKVEPSWQTSFYIGAERTVDEGTKAVFGSVQTLAQRQHLERFPSDYFDLIVVDEFHHAAAASYRRVIDHFTPRFLLGLTATPDRMDGADVYAICDNNVAYQMHFTAAIEEGFLAPFHYFGIYDLIDYKQIRRIGRRYDATQLEHAQIDQQVTENIYEAWHEHRQTKTIAFCSSVRQAEYLAEHFTRKGHESVALTGKTLNRHVLIDQFENGSLDIVFTVDLFNEGVDIPKTDTLLFCRPTESIAVYVQQIGRGLRLASGKTHCVIIDLIGNYQNVETKLKLLGEPIAKLKRGATEPITSPKGCAVHFDVEAMDVIRRMRQPNQRKYRLLENYEQLKTDLGRRPSYVEIGRLSTVPSVGYRQEWGSYIGFLETQGELTQEEVDLFEANRGLLEVIEKTVMTRSYKMVVLLAMLERSERWAEPIMAQEVAPFFYAYLHAERYRKEKDAMTSKNLQGDFDSRKVEKLLHDQPFPRFGKPFLFEKDVLTIEGYCNLEHPTLYRWVKDIVIHRLDDYFSCKMKE
ncbi:DEAD/DEAH box helicase family protein [Exiguobacterium flavidum]|uniref:DEAD/DEAH box helicase family protein n=1 Tax=Exiguobacterium flavidum TaxID=2184695 RepID=UPI000DF8325D|nr:DEAD/DEAH box helicase family protein [Exiguobacterium flavidum]